MRKLAAALGAIVLMATVTAGPVAAAKPVPTFGVSVCINSDGRYLISASWENVHGAYELVSGGSNEVTDTTTPTEVEWVILAKGSANVGDYVSASKYTGYQYVAVTLVNRKGSPIVPWTYYAIDSLAPCS